MSQLPDDCVMALLDYLSLRSRVQLEGINRQWYYLIQISYGHTLIINIPDMVHNCEFGYYQQDNVGYESTVEGAIKHFGHLAVEINFGARYYKVSRRILKAIEKYCGELLSRLNLKGTIIHDNLNPLLYTFRHQLTCLSLGDVQWIKEENREGLPAMLQELKLLQNLDLQGLKLSSFGWLPHISPILRKLNLNHTRYPDAESICEVLRNHRETLVSLGLAGLKYIDSVILDEVSKLEHLDALDLSHISQEQIDMSAMLIPDSLITELHLQDNSSITDGTFQQICTHWCPHLALLDITGCKKLRNYSLLQHCFALKILKAGRTPHLADWDLEGIAERGTLESLTLFRCTSITDAGIIEVLNNCPIVYLTADFCPNLTNSSFNAALAKQGLKELSIQGNNISRVEINNLTQSIDSIYLNNCRAFDDECVAILMSLAASRDKKLSLAVSQTAVSQAKTDGGIIYI